MIEIDNAELMAIVYSHVANIAERFEIDDPNILDALVEAYRAGMRLVMDEYGKVDFNE